MKRSLIWAGALIALVMSSCSTDEPKGETGYGEFAPTFTADYTVKDAKATTKAGSVPTVMQPNVSDFYVHLSRTDGSVDKTWSKVSEMSKTEKFPVGNYNLETYYGNINEEGFDKPYYYGKTEFTIYDSEVSEPEVVATLCNTMVSVDYTDAFISYFAEYSTTIHSAGGAYIIFEMGETRAAYVKPGNVTIGMTLTNREGKTINIEPAGITAAQARTHYHITFDVNGGEVGEVVLIITFDDNTTDGGEVTINLGDELFNADEPESTPENFTSGETISIIEGDELEAAPKIHLAAMAGFSEVILTTQSEYLLAQGWPAEIDLTKVTPAQKALLMKYGLNASGVWSSTSCTMGLIDFTKMMPLLRVYNGSSTHTFTVVAKDILTRVTQPLTVTISAPSVVMSLPASVTVEPAQTDVTCEMTYSGVNLADNVELQYLKSNGTWDVATIKSVEALGDNKYNVTFTLPLMSSDTQVKAVYKNGVKTTDVMAVVRDLPELTLTMNDYDVYSYSATATYTASKYDYATLNKVLTVYLSSNGGSTFVATKNYTVDGGTISLTGLSAGSNYQIKISVAGSTNKASNTVSFSTEADTQLPNSDMESWSKNKIGKTSALFSSNKEVYDYLPYASGETDIWWATNNARGYDYTTARVESTSSCVVCWNSTLKHGGSYSAQIYTSCHGGKGADTNAGSVSVVYPENAFAGRLFIGTYAWSSGETVTTGHEYTSRPQSLSFWYQYLPKNSDQYKVEVEVRSDDTVIGSGSYIPESTSDATSAFQKATVDINYTITNKKATSIYVSFWSTTMTSFSSSDFNIDVSTQIGDETLRVHRGSMLYVDDLSLSFK
ncbi:MAG: DUF4493 domain-containing protein [Muribaculaceae bacterium]